MISVFERIREKAGTSEFTKEDLPELEALPEKQFRRRWQRGAL